LDAPAKELATDIGSRRLAEAADGKGVKPLV
jgi:hypothetical protein